jgi:very-short-patch-repair endonuclease
MRAIDINIQEGTSFGTKSLRNYLQYAADGILQDSGGPTGDEPDSDFEIAVMRLLEEKGFACTPQFGVAKYKLDIVVHDPGNPSNYLMAIECDGATYHSSKSSRDRDITRQRVLESLNWKVRRIWSTDWFTDPEVAIKGILRELAQDATPISARATESATKKAQLETLREESSDYDDNSINESTDLETALISFNEHKILPEFPNTPEGKRLLRPQMLNKFVSACPFDRDEFIEGFPAYLRAGTAADEAGRFLDDILDIVKRVA